MQKKYVGEKAVIGALTRMGGYPISVARKACQKTERYLELGQLEPPAKGAFIKQSSAENEAWVASLQNKVMKAVSQRAARNPNYKELYIFENFQLDQKGPVKKVNVDRLLDSVSTVIENSSSEIISKEGMGHIDKASERLIKQLDNEGLRNSIHASDIQPAYAWSTMAHSKSRGIPWLVKGNMIVWYDGSEITVDDAIIRTYGNDMSDIVRRTANLSFIVGMIGVRLQGQPDPNPAKVRIIFMPEIPEQYALRAVQLPIQELLKRKSQLGYAWADPDKYWTNMGKAMSSQNDKYFYVSLDYSKFDTRSSWYIRNKAFECLLGVILDEKIPWKMELIDAIKRLWVQQYMLVPNKKGNVELVQVANLLTSGDVFTQLLGNVINRIYQFAIAEALGYDIPDTIGNQLGDDTLLAVKKEILIKLGGYAKLLAKVEEIIETWGSKMNLKKQYPSILTSIFLQRAYNYPIGIIGEYSLIRAIDSLVWAENPRMAIDGVKNLDALETIGQFSVLNNIIMSQGKVTNKDLLLTIILPAWLTVDDALRGLVSDSLAKAKGDFRLAGAYAFAYLVAATGGKQSVAEGLGLNSFDKHDLLPILRRKDALSISLPILTWVCEAASNMTKFSFAYSEVYGMTTKVNANHIKDYYNEW